MSIWSDGTSPHEVLIRKAYKEAGYHDWKNDRISRLCRRLQCSREVLWAMSGLSHRKGFCYWKSNEWPAEVGIHFSFFDSVQASRETGTLSVPGAQHAVLAKLITNQ